MATKLSHPPVEGKLRRRLLSLNNIETKRCWRNQDHIRKWLAYSGVIENPQQLNWLEKYEKLGFVRECEQGGVVNMRLLTAEESNGTRPKTFSKSHDAELAR